MKNSNPQMVEFEITIRDVINAHISSDGITVGELVGALMTIAVEIVIQHNTDRIQNGEEDED